MFSRGSVARIDDIALSPQCKQEFQRGLALIFPNLPGEGSCPHLVINWVLMPRTVPGLTLVAAGE